MQIVDVPRDGHPRLRSDRPAGRSAARRRAAARPRCRRRSSAKAAAMRRRRWMPVVDPPTAATISGGRAVRARRGIGRRGEDVAREVEVLWHPIADRREPRPERSRHDVLGIADEDRGVAQPRIAFDVRDVLGVVVAREPRLRFVHRQPADEVGEERVRRGLQARILVQEVVDLPRLVPEPEVIVALAHDVVEEHEVRDEHLIELTPGLERVQLVLARRAPRTRSTRSRGGAMPGESARLPPRARR